MSLRDLKAYADMIVTYKSLSCNMADEFDLSQVVSCTRGDGVRLNQRRAKTRVAKSFFICRVPNVWNSLPDAVVSLKTLSVFKRTLKRHFLLH